MKPGRISPGFISLFLDELAEFSPSVLETLREPLEEGAVTISRAGTAATYPARFTLVAAMNPCRFLSPQVGALKACVTCSSTADRLVVWRQPRRSSSI